MAIPKAKELKNEDVKELLSMEKAEFTLPKLREFFSCFLGGADEPRF